MDRQSRIIRYMLLSLLLASSVGATATADKVVVTSGRVVYDAFGRAVATYHPTVDTDSVYDFIAAIDTVDPTCTTYDILDRPVRVVYPDGTETNTSYRVEGHALVTHVTDALGNETETHVSGSGRTLKSIQFDGTEQIVTQFTYDGIGRLVEVLDADTNVTVSEYDMGDRRVRVTHPASGETTFTYDALGNVLTRQTANLRDSALFIEYGYDRGRLISVNYPEHPENNVRYYYGGANDQDNAKGRLCLRLDATGGEQYGYDNMGNVKETVRTVTVPNEDVGTFKTEFEYDSFGKLLSLTYPDGEKVCYWYDGSGQLTEVYVKERKNGYRYVEEIGYDKFGDRVYMRYGNGAETEYAYNDEMRRLDSLSLASPHTTLKRIYGYDAVGNILSVTNSGTGLLHNSPVSHTYVYDNLYRLTEAHGTTGSAQTGYDLSMSYDNMYRITGKTQGIRQTGIQFAGTLNAGYDLAYSYDRTPGRRFRMSSVSDVNYRTVGAPEDGDYIDEEHFYAYDPNGNILHVNTGRWKRDGVERELSREEKFRWDEENRLMAISQDGYVSNYWYDADGERVIKEHGGNQAVFVNSEQDGVLTDTRQFTIYPSAYLTVHNGSWYTKHIYIGSERIASRMGTMLVDDLSETFEANAILAGENVFEEIDYDGQCDTLARVMRSNYAYFDLPYNGENRHGEEMVSTPPQSGDPGILGTGGARHYWMLADADAADADTEGGEGGGPTRGPRRAENVNYNGNRYFYHSDHLGSSSLITDASGNVTQQLDYLPYGEVFLEKRSQDPDVDYFTPYRFNGKELDEETGLYYYGARYMNPRLSIWYATDPMQEKYPNVSTYTYCNGNSVAFIDDDGDTPTIVSGLIGAGVGAIIGGGIEMGTQLYKHGKVANWKAIKGATAQGAITGGVAGLTGGASLFVSSMATGTANVAGGYVNREIQGQSTTSKDIVTDFVVGATFGAGGRIVEQGTVAKLFASKLTKQAHIAIHKVTEMGLKPGSVYGTKAHKFFADAVRGMESNGYTIKTEVSYLNGRIVPYGTKGSARIDAGVYDKSGNLVHVFDLKTGNAKLTAEQIKHIQTQTRTKVQVTVIRGK